MSKTRLIIVDDHQLVIDGLKNLVSQIHKVDLVGTFSDARKALSFVENNALELVVIDVSMPHISGGEFVQKVKQFNTRLRFVVMTMHNDPKTIKKMIQLGADGYVLKSAEYGILHKAIETVMSGSKYYDPDVQRVLDNSFKPTAESQGQRITLSKRELGVLELMSEGLTTDEIAEKLFISKHTVNSHRKNLSFKFDTSRPIELLTKAKNLGFI